MIEIWKPIENYETFYEVSNLGRIRSVSRHVTDKLGRTRFLEGRIIKPGGVVEGRKYLMVCLCKNGKMSSVTVHTAVAKAHVPGRKPGLEVRHLDGDASNNWATNLAWGTKKQNMKDKVLHGTSSRGEGNGCAKLTEAQVREIKALFKAKTMTDKEIAALYPAVKLDTIRRIKYGRLWRHV